jgi:hypothetical protein
MARNPQFAWAFGFLLALFGAVGAAATAQDEACMATVRENGGAIGTESPKNILLQHAVGDREKNVVNDPPLPMMLLGGNKSAQTPVSYDRGLGVWAQGPTGPVNVVVYPNFGEIPGIFTSILTTGIEGQKSASIQVTADAAGTPTTVQKFTLYGINPDQPLYHPRIEISMELAQATGFGLDVKARVLPDGEWTTAEDNPIPMDLWSNPTQTTGETGVCSGLEMINKMVCKDGTQTKYEETITSAEACLAKCEEEANKPARWCCVWNRDTEACRYQTDDFSYIEPDVSKGKWNAAHCEHS